MSHKKPFHLADIQGSNDTWSRLPQTGMFEPGLVLWTL